MSCYTPSWSDGYRSRWGRRHPLILVGGLGTAVMFIALFSPPAGLSQWGMFAWFTATAIVLRTFFYSSNLLLWASELLNDRSGLLVGPDSCCLGEVLQVSP